MAYTERKDAPFRKRGGFHRKKKVCVFCGKDNAIDYKDTAKLRKYVSESGKILPRRITGTCATRPLRSREPVIWLLCPIQSAELRAA